MGWGSSDEDMRARLQAVLEPGKEVIWTGRKQVLFDLANRQQLLIGAILITICWGLTGIVTFVTWHLYATLELIPNFVFMSALLSWMWCFYLSMDRSGKFARPLSLFFLAVLTISWVFTANRFFQVWLSTPESNIVYTLLAGMSLIAVSSFLASSVWVILKGSRNGVPSKLLLLTDRRFGFFSPFPLFHANDRVVTTPLEGISEISVRPSACGNGDLTLVEKWSWREPRFYGPCTIYDVERVEDLARKLGSAAGVEPTISKA